MQFTQGHIASERQNQDPKVTLQHCAMLPSKMSDGNMGKAETTAGSAKVWQGQDLCTTGERRGPTAWAGNVQKNEKISSLRLSSKGAVLEEDGAVLRVLCEGLLERT